MIREIEAKKLLAHSKAPDPWFGIRYNLNIYRGCQHQCIYCDSRSLCYGIEDFRDVLVKVNAIACLRDELPRKRAKGTIGTGSMSDPYGPVEQAYRLTGQALEVIAEHGFPLHLLTKGDMVLRDLDTIVAINQVQARISFTVTTADDALAAQVEPGAPAPSRRYAAMARLAAAGVPTGVLLMPVLPFIEDHEDNVRLVVERAADSGASYILAAFGMTMRDRQRQYYYERLDALFPGLRARYERQYGERYECQSPRAQQLWSFFSELCAQHGLATRIEPWLPQAPSRQPPLL
jgi:DNA repair photolyase